MVQEIQCKYCDTKFERKIYGNFSIRCPHCYRLLEHLSDYGFGPVTPFYICVGNEVVGIVESERNECFLNFQGRKIKLKETYFDAVHEAEKYIVDALQIAIKEVETNIVTEKGSLWFYGESFGRPYDNLHKIKSISYDGKILIITFDQWEELFVYNPEDIESTEKELKIGKASKVKWSYIPYGSMSARKTITYEYDDNKVIKTTEYGTKEILYSYAVAVLLAGY